MAREGRIDEKCSEQTLNQLFQPGLTLSFMRGLKARKCLWERFLISYFNEAVAQGLRVVRERTALSLWIPIKTISSRGPKSGLERTGNWPCLLALWLHFSLILTGQDTEAHGDESFAQQRGCRNPGPA